ncbi:MAG: division/cell wall cluster transcriptional repressor MraZ [Bacteroidetes bacterium]|nr:division/cell wall cluster transcriptional repressor MraZ [Bacteroidota bacterium]
MLGFKGKYDHAVDDKGRVSLPSKLRKNLSPEANDSFVITRGYEFSLDLYPIDVWTRFEEDLRTHLNMHREEDRLYIRTLMMWAHEVTLDRQARIMIPQEHMEFAGIRDKVIILGTLDKIEIWSPENLRNYHEHNANQPYESVASHVMGGM